MTSFILAARSKLEQDTGIALFTQTHDEPREAFPSGLTPIQLPWRPVQSVTSVKSTDTAGVVNTLAADQYVLDPSSVSPRQARLALSDAGVWPTDLQSFQPIVIRYVVGFTSVALLTAAAPLLVHAVGLLVAHYATLGRDLASLTPADLVPYGYDDAISSYRLVTVA